MGCACNPSIVKRKQEDHCKFEASQLEVESYRLARSIYGDLVSTNRQAV